MANLVKDLGLNTGVLYDDRRDFYLSPKITKELWPVVTPFLSLVSSRNIVTVPDPDFKMFEHRSGWANMSFQRNDASASGWTAGGVPNDYYAEAIVPDYITGFAGGLNTAASAVGVNDSWIGKMFEVWSNPNDDGKKVTYKGVVWCSAVTADTSLTIKVVGNPTSATQAVPELADNDIFQCIGSMYGTGTEAPGADADELQVVYNSCGIEKTSIEITGTLYAAALRGYTNELARLRDEKMKEHKILQEYKCLFSHRAGGTGSSSPNTNTDSFQTSIALLDVDSKPIRTTMGVVPALRRYGNSTATSATQNVFTINEATYSYSNLIDDMTKVFYYIPTSGEKYAFAGPEMFAFWSKLSNAGTQGFLSRSGFTVNLENREKDGVGFDFSRLITPMGNLKLVNTPALRNNLPKSMIYIDDENVFRAEYRPSTYKTNIKTDNAYDGIKDQIMSDMGMGLTLMERHGMFTLA